MLQDDSNGETFEIIDKKTEELSLGVDKAGKLARHSELSLHNIQIHNPNLNFQNH